MGIARTQVPNHQFFIGIYILSTLKFSSLKLKFLIDRFAKCS